jgi:hypothetical protein
LCSHHGVVFLTALKLDLFGTSRLASAVISSHIIAEKLPMRATVCLVTSQQEHYHVATKSSAPEQLSDFDSYSVNCRHFRTLRSEEIGVL